MNQVFIRSEQLADKIHDIKLHIPQWKVLFAVDGRMSVPEISQFLELDQDEVEKALSRLQEMQLIRSEGGGDSPVEEIREAAEGISDIDKTFEEFERVEQSESPGEEIGEEEQVDFSGQVEAESPQEEVPEEFGEAESDQEFPSFGSEEEAMEESKEETEMHEEPTEEELQEETPAEEEDVPFDLPAAEKESDEEDLGSEFEELKLEEEETAEEQETDEETEQDLDSLINDLLKEETGGEEGEEGPKILDDAEMAEWETVQETDLIEEPTQETEIPDVETETPAVEEEELTETAAEEDVETAAEEQPEEMEEEVVTPSPSAEQKTILVVDDSIVIRKMVEIALENENYNVVSVPTGKEAFAFLDDKEPNMVILDIMLPDMNGLDILKAIKSKSEIPVVMLSAKDTPKETSKAKELGANDFIPKPFRDEELINKIHELIGQ